MALLREGARLCGVVQQCFRSRRESAREDERVALLLAPTTATCGLLAHFGPGSRAEPGVKVKELATRILVVEGLSPAVAVVPVDVHGAGLAG